MLDLEELAGMKSITVAGIETGNMNGAAAAIVAELEGSGESTECNLKYYTNRTMSPELKEMLAAVDRGRDFGVEELAGINFLFLHHISSLYGQIFEETEIKRDEIDLVGLKCMEIGGREFPLNPADLSEMIGNIVVSHFSITMGREALSLPLEESILKTLVPEMIEEFEFGEEAHGALGVTLFANESLRNKHPDKSKKQAGNPGTATAGDEPGGREAEIVFNGDFFIPS